MNSSERHFSHRTRASGRSRSISKTSTTATVFTRLVADYDVILENFRPGVMDRLGFGWDAVRTINPSVIYCAVSGFGQTGPMRDRPAYDQIIQGLSGLMSVTGTKRPRRCVSGCRSATASAAIVAAFAICAALVRRARPAKAPSSTSRCSKPRSPRWAGWSPTSSIAGVIPPDGEREPHLGAVRHVRHRRRQAEHRGEQAGAVRGALRGVGHDRNYWPTPGSPSVNPRDITATNCAKNWKRRLAQKSAREWDEQLMHIGVPAAPVVTVREALESAHIRARELIHTVASPSARGGTLRLLGSPVHVDGQAIGPACSATGSRCQHRRRTRRIRRNQTRTRGSQ